MNEIKIIRQERSLREEIIRIFKYVIISDVEYGINRTKLDNNKTINIYLLNDEKISYNVKNIDLISTSKLFKKLINANYLNNTSIE